MRTFIISLFFTAPLAAFAQNAKQDTLVLSRAASEKIFLESNINLIAEKLNIDKQQAMIVQAKVWPNPTLSVTDINLWSNATAEQLPVLWGNYGRTQEVAVGLEQLIYTAGKRKKLIAIEKVKADMVNEYFKDVLRGLKLEFRNNLTQLQLNQLEAAVYKKQLASMQKLLGAYSKQVQMGNVSKSEYVRLKASELDFIKHLDDLQKENNALQKELKVLMNISPQAYVKITDDGFLPPINVEGLDVAALTEAALKNRPDVKYAKLTEDYSQAQYKYERALRTPDVTFQMSYDRGGNIMNNFVGFGFSIDLPFFNRNQGNIGAAKIEAEQSRLFAQQKNIAAQAEVIEAYGNLLSARRVYDRIDEGYEKDLDLMLDSYQKNFVQRNTSLLEYLDFVEAYLQNKSIILNAEKDLNTHLEELKYVSGEEINQ